jgi:hypothetical protein
VLAPKPPVVLAPNPPVVPPPPPNKPVVPVPVPVAEDPNPVLFWPKRPPPVFADPKADVVLVFEAPNPPNPDPPVVPPPPNSPPPVVPEPKGLDPKVVVVLLLLPKPPAGISS